MNHRKIEISTYEPGRDSRDDIWGNSSTSNEYRVLKETGLEGYRRLFPHTPKSAEQWKTEEAEFRRVLRAEFSGEQPVTVKKAGEIATVTAIHVEVPDLPAEEVDVRVA